jgi:hypothetical protein
MLPTALLTQIRLIHYLYLLPHVKQHIDQKNSAKKGLLFLALLLSIFAFSGAVNIAQQSNPLTQSELILKANNVIKSSIRYKSAAQLIYKTPGSFFADKQGLATSAIVFERLVKTMGLHLKCLAIPKRQVFFSYHTNIPHASRPTQPAYRA